MSRIRSSKTRPELKLKQALESLNFEYQPIGIYGRPDFANKSDRVALFIDGCYWHKCPHDFVVPKTRTEFWLQKIDGNVKRDKMVNKKLENDGWKVIRIWEHDVKKHPNRVISRVKRMLKSK
jgi:DNA mismatch endonuclease (patch repair protein)